jgi:hypothetical protein
MRAYLLARGVPAAPVRVVAHGETGQPMFETLDGAAEPQNRYVVVIIKRMCTGLPERGLEPCPTAETGTKCRGLIALADRLGILFVFSRVRKCSEQKATHQTRQVFA